MNDSTAVSLAKQYLSRVEVGEWEFKSDRLYSPSGETILWASRDNNGVLYIGLMEDYVDFIARSSLLVQALLDEVEALKAARAAAERTTP